MRWAAGAISKVDPATGNRGCGWNQKLRLVGWRGLPAGAEATGAGATVSRIA